MSQPSAMQVVVLAGGTSTEREISLGSGRASAVALARSFPTRLVDVAEESLPAGLRPERDVVFSTLHGTFGEDGGMQRMLEDAGVSFAGCDAASSAFCFDKELTRKRSQELGLKVPLGQPFDGAEKPDAVALVAALGEGIVIKPQRGGSSVGLAICSSREEVTDTLSRIDSGAWLAEQRIIGREVTVGMLNGEALPVVEIAPKSGVFDYAAKYTKGQTEYLAPAPLPSEVITSLQRDALALYASCGCRDYARIDFIITAEFDRFLLEINTLPGMKETSLLPMGANCAGMDFTALVAEMIEPARQRWLNRYGNGGQG